MYSLKILIYNFKHQNKAKGWFRKSMEKNKYEGNISIVIALKALTLSSS
jgi:hypothetical protein